MSGVGTELAKLIPDWAIQFKDGCGCKDMEKKMNKWGPEGCQNRADSIVRHLMAQSDMLIPAFKMIPTPARKAVAGQMLRYAIKKSIEG